uniref:TAFII28-like protein domain-containing protein n=1 Tax=Guillardia theta TaxID=55529 RepID=A0A7S4K9D0_GUITH
MADEEDVDVDEDMVKQSLPTFSSNLQSFQGTGSSHSSDIRSIAVSSHSNKPQPSPEKSKKSKRDDVSESVKENESVSGEGGKPQPPKKKSKKKKPSGEKKQDGAETSSKSPSKKDSGVDKDKDDLDLDKKDLEASEKKDVDGELSDDEDPEDAETALDEKFKEAQKARESMLLKTASEEDWKRYTAMRQSKFNDNVIKSMISQISEIPAGNIRKPVLFTMAGIAKIFVGEIIDTARVVRQEWGECQDGAEPLQPRHIQEAYRRMLLEGKVPESGVPRARFNR